MEENDFRNEDGTLKSGHKGLKPKGASNRLQLEIKNKITEFLAGRIDCIEEIYSEVSAKDKLRFLTELLSFVLPKSKIILEPEKNESSRTDFSLWSTEDLRTVSNLLEKYKTQDE